ncbi:EF-hand domain-containing protein [Bradyrhizobium japonicum]
MQSLTNSKSSSSTQKTGSSQNAPINPFAIDSGSSTTSGATSPVNAGKTPQIAPETMNALFAAQSQSSSSTGSTASSTSSSSASSTPTSRDAALKDLFSQIDGDGDGKITKSEFENALGAGGTNLAQADDVFSKMDTNSDGSVSLDEMSKALKSGHHGQHAHGAGGSGDGSDSSAKPSGGSTSTTTTAADGSTTTTVTYADGFKMSTTVPGASSSSRNSAYDLFAQLMQRQGGQGQGASATAGSSMSMSV